MTITHTDRGFGWGLERIHILVSLVEAMVVGFSDLQELQTSLNNTQGKPFISTSFMAVSLGGQAIVKHQ